MITSSLRPGLGDQFPGVVVALGTFDGVHRGHQEILRRVRGKARAIGGAATVMTFVRHPLEILNPPRAPQLITPLPVKTRILERMGLDLLVPVEFTPELAATAAGEFVRRCLGETLRAKAVFVGYDFAFGKGREGTPDLLVRLGQEYGFSVEVVPPVTVGGEVVSSTLIRSLLREGRVAEAAQPLGRPYIVSGTIERGRGRGRGLGFPTANLVAGRDLLLPDGIYAVHCLLGSRVYKGVVNIGVSPTFGDVERRMEVYLFELNEEIYGEELWVFFGSERLRPEERFATPEALRAQIARDVALAHEVLRRSPSGIVEEWALQ